MTELRGPTRLYGVIISHPIDETGKRMLNCRIDVRPDSGKAESVVIWRDYGMGKGHDIDKAFDKISRKISRVIQGRAP